MTDQRDKLIDSILEQYSVWEYRRAFHLAMRALLKRELSDKLILDRKQLEEMIEKINLLPRLGSTDRGKSEIQYVINAVMIYINDLLTNQANDSD